MRCERCPFKGWDDAIYPVICACGKKFFKDGTFVESEKKERGADVVKLAVPNQARPMHILPETSQERIHICGSCCHREKDHCGVLQKLGKGSKLMAPRGIPNRLAVCPLDPPRWGNGKIDLMAFTPTSRPPRLAIITTHYNPLGYRRLRDTYYQWLPTLGPLADCLRCYELVFDDDQPEINGSIVIRGTRDRHWLWQKESLINRGLRDLPSDIDYVAWIDHDFVIGDPEWAAKAIDAIDAGAVAVQLFGKFNFLNRRNIVTEYRRSAMANHTAGKPAKGSPGGAWMASRAFLDSIGGLPDQSVVGGGDQVWLDIVVGKPGWHLNTYPPALRQSIEDSIHRGSKAKGERTGGVVDVNGYHIWHGDRSNRQYVERTEILRRHDFDPSRDTRINADGLREWTTENTQMKREMREYFAARREDG